MKKKVLLWMMALMWVLVCPAMAATGANGEDDEDPMQVFVGKQYIDLQMKDLNGQTHRLGAVPVVQNCQSWSRCIRHSIQMASRS